MGKHEHTVFRRTPMKAIVVLCSLSTKGKYTFSFLLCVLALPALFLHPVDTLVIQKMPDADRQGAPLQNANAPLFQASAGLGQAFSTEYVHSLQLTPVKDIYRIVNGRIWSWQERVQSHNAGLPFAKPVFGRFRMEPPWMIIEGGRQSWKSIVLRVGDAEFGRNLFAYGEEGALQIALYETLPRQPLRLSIERQPLIALIRPPKFPE